MYRYSNYNTALGAARPQGVRHAAVFSPTKNEKQERKETLTSEYANNANGMKG
jgi:hypothetical protein